MTVTEWSGANYPGGPMGQGGCAYCYGRGTASTATAACTRSCRSGGRVVHSNLPPQTRTPRRLIERALPKHVGHPCYSARFWLRYDGVVYLAPLKLAAIDANGTLPLEWWHGNNTMKGGALPRSELELSAAARHEPAQGGGAGDTDVAATGSRSAGSDGIRALPFTAPLNDRNGTIAEGTSAGGCAGGPEVGPSLSTEASGTRAPR